MSAIMTVEDLRVSFATEDGVVKAVDGVSFELAAGEVLAIVGESGCGKSVTAQTLTGLTRASNARITGSVNYRGREINGLTDNQLRDVRGEQIAMVFQDPMCALNPVYRVGDQITEMIRAHRDVSKKEAKAKAIELLRSVGIPNADRRVRLYPHEFSGGMRQRVMIAMALVLEPEVVIMDEPTTALDVVMQRQILGQLIELREQLDFSVLFITHDLSLLVEFSNRIAIMYGGRIVEEAPAAALYKDSLHPYSDGLLHSFPALRGARQELTGIPGSPPDLRAMPTGCVFHPRCPKRFEPCDKEVPVLGAPATPAASVSPDPRAVACWLHPTRVTPMPAGAR